MLGWAGLGWGEARSVTERGMNSPACISRLLYSIEGLIKFRGKESCNRVLKGGILALKILKIDIALSHYT